MGTRNLGSDNNGNTDQPTCRSRRHEPGSTPPLVPGLHVCWACRNVVEEALVELPALFDLCAYALDLRPNGPRERVSETRPHGIVLADAVVSVRAEILGVLAAWCGLVTGERGVAPPDELDIRKLVAFLDIHLHWLCQHPTAPNLVDDVTSLTDSVNAALRPEAGFRVAVGTCLDPKCDRAVYATHDDSGALSQVACDAGHVWPPQRWLALRGKPQDNRQERAV